MVLTVQALVVNVTLTVNGHIITGNSSGSTTAAVNANAGTGATCTVSGNDTAGTITIVTGTGSGTAGAVSTTYTMEYIVAQ